jgi:hypothetical protein
VVGTDLEPHHATKGVTRWNRLAKKFFRNVRPAAVCGQILISDGEEATLGGLSTPKRVHLRLLLLGWLRQRLCFWFVLLEFHRRQGVALGDVFDFILVNGADTHSGDDGVAIKVRWQLVAPVDYQRTRQSQGLCIAICPQQLVLIFRIHADFGAVPGTFVLRSDVGPFEDGGIPCVLESVATLGGKLSRGHFKVCPVNGVQQEWPVVRGELGHGAGAFIEHRLDIRVKSLGHVGSLNVGLMRIADCTL